MRRKRGTGSVSQRKDGRWSAEWPGPPKRRTTKATREQAEAWLDAQRHERGTVHTLGSWLARWWQQNQHGWTDSTRLSYLKRMRRAAPLGAVLLADLRADHFRGLMADMQREGCELRYARLIVGTVGQALEQAIDDELLVRNPATVALRGQRLPRKQERAIWSEQQARTFVQAASGHRFETLYLLALGFGLRIGELVALTWSAVDFERGTLTVAQQINEMTGKLSGPKHGSTRRFSLSPAWVAMLQARYEAQRSRGLFVASDARGRPYNVNALRRDFHSLTLTAGLPRMRVHDLRHFAASELVNSGVSVTRAAAVLGHSSPTITMGRYAHPSAGDEGAPAALMEWLLERD